MIWTGQRTLDFAKAPQTQKPTEISAGALGASLPKTALAVSPQHRVLLSNDCFFAVAGQKEVFTPAESFIETKGFRQMSGKRQVTYHSLLLRRHEVIFANSLAVESLYPGRMALSVLSQRQCLEIFTRMPALLADTPTGYGPPSRPVISVRKYKK